ncbi:MAG TPA: DUF211 domain-containing protein [Gammaproteobacteria bacterium]
MSRLKRVVLDVLKPREPNIIEFAKAIAMLGTGYRVNLRVDEVDDRTESVILEVEAEEIDFDALQAVINNLGASLHSVDEVEVAGQGDIPAVEA